MRRAASFASIGLLVSLFGSGCVQQDRYDHLLHANRTLKEQNAMLAEERDSALTNLDAVQRELGQARGDVRSLEGKNVDLDSHLQRVAGDYDGLLERVSSLDLGPLPPEVEMALEDLASAYPDVLTFDARKGMLRFSSDFTFGLGSTDLQPEALATIATVADILNSSTAVALEVKVVGHTDNVPIGKPDTLRRHPTNTHLSVHRSIAVRDALVHAGVNAERIEVAGFGEHRPVVTNGPKGAAANRRVEVFLTAMPGATPSRSSRNAQGISAQDERPIISNEPMK